MATRPFRTVAAGVTPEQVQTAVETATAPLEATVASLPTSTEVDSAITSALAAASLATDAEVTASITAAISAALADSATDAELASAVAAAVASIPPGVTLAQVNAAIATSLSPINDDITTLYNRPTTAAVNALISTAIAAIPPAPEPTYGAGEVSVFEPALGQVLGYGGGGQTWLFDPASWSTSGYAVRTDQFMPWYYLNGATSAAGFVAEWNGHYALPSQGTAVVEGTGVRLTFSPAIDYLSVRDSDTLDVYAPTWEELPTTLGNINVSFHDLDAVNLAPGTPLNRNSTTRLLVVGDDGTILANEAYGDSFVRPTEEYNSYRSGTSGTEFQLGANSGTDLEADLGQYFEGVLQAAPSGALVPTIVHYRLFVYYDGSRKVAVVATTLLSGNPVFSTRFALSDASGIWRLSVFATYTGGTGAANFNFKGRRVF